MTARVLDGAALAAGRREAVARRVEALLAAGGPRPGLAAVLVGDDPASHTYVRAKRAASAEAGIESSGYELATDTPQPELEAILDRLNADPKVHAILVQLPLPAGLDEAAAIDRIRIEKDVDGLSARNLGRLAQKGSGDYTVPATPAGILALLEEAGARLDGARAVVLGRSRLVGMPLALLLLRENATVTVCHSHTVDLPGICRTADVLVAAIGVPEMVRGDWIRPGAIVIDVGVNRVEDPEAPKRYRLVGDVAFEEALEVAGAVTPVPGGVGPMTVALLLENTLLAAERAFGR